MFELSVQFKLIWVEETTVSTRLLGAAAVVQVGVGVGVEFGVTVAVAVGVGCMWNLELALL